MDITAVIDHVSGAIYKGEKEESNLSASLLKPDLLGLSSNKVRHFFNNLCSVPGWRHLEIGTCSGSTLISAGYQNKLDYIVSIDDFSMKPENKLELDYNLRDLRWKDILPPIFRIEADCWKVNKGALQNNFDTYFYDAYHSQAAQRKAITEYWECLTDQAVIVIDDYDVKRVNRGTMEGFKRLGVEDKIVKKWHLKGGTVKTREDLWWGGLGVFVIDKQRS